MQKGFLLPERARNSQYTKMWIQTEYEGYDIESIWSSTLHFLQQDEVGLKETDQLIYNSQIKDNRIKVQPNEITQAYETLFTNINSSLQI